MTYKGFFLFFWELHLHIYDNFEIVKVQNEYFTLIGEYFSCLERGAKISKTPSNVVFDYIRA